MDAIIYYSAYDGIIHLLRFYPDDNTVLSGNMPLKGNTIDLIWLQNWLNRESSDSSLAKGTYSFDGDRGEFKLESAAGAFTATMYTAYDKSLNVIIKNFVNTDVIKSNYTAFGNHIPAPPKPVRDSTNEMQRKIDAGIIEMFPDPADVFYDRVEEHAEYLFPLFSVKLEAINPQWSGKLHILQFNEDPYNQEAAGSFTEYCSDQMIAFDIIDGKYRLQTDLGYFAVTDEWKEYAEKTRRDYHALKSVYKENGNHPDKIYEQLGGEPEWIQGGSAPLDPEGVPMTFITRVYSSDYADDGGKDYYLFYSHSCKMAVILYQVT